MPANTDTRPRVHEVGDGVYAYLQPDGSWFLNNAGFVLGPDRVLSVDTCATQRRTLDYQDAIAATTGLPVQAVVNTHHHGDHTNGNYLFEGADVIAHDNCRDHLLDEVADYSELFGPIDWGALRTRPPNVTFTDELVLYLGDLRCEIRHPGRVAHTPDDVVVWLPERSVLFAGDLAFNGGTPFLAEGSLFGLRETVQELRELRPRTVVPGHGELCGPEVFERTLRYLDFLEDLARRGKDAGLSALDTALQAELGEFAELGETERLVPNLMRAYAELDGIPPATPLDMTEAARGMLTFHGTTALPCKV